MLDAIVNFLGSILIGVASGSVYALLALGIVLIYKTQRVVNFAAAEFATVSALAFHGLVQEGGLGLGGVRIGGLPVGTLVACVIAVGAGGLLSVLVERVVIRPLRDARDVTVFVATAGVGLLTIAVGRLFYVDPVQVEPPFGRFTLQFATYTLSTQQIVVILVLVGVAVALVALFASPLGKALLALSREPFAVRLAGLSVAKLSVAIWLLAGLVAGLAGVAEGPNQTLGPGLFTTQFLFPALTGAVLGGLTSLPGAIAGGLAVGIAQSLATAYAADLGIPGPDTIIVFAILLAVLLLRPQGLLAKEG